MNNINNLFIAAMGNKNIKGFRAVFEMRDGKIGTTASYTRETLKAVIEDIMHDVPEAKLLKIIPE